MAGTIESEENGTSLMWVSIRGLCVCASRRHVIICGHIETHSLASFLHDFLHKGREEVDELDVLIIDKYVRRAISTVVSILARHSKKEAWHWNGSTTQTILLENSVLRREHHEHHRSATSAGEKSIVALERNSEELPSKVDRATACLIIANKECSDPNGDDSANIMRVISLKNFNHHIRVLLQLLQYHNKVARRDCLDNHDRLWSSSTSLRYRAGMPIKMKSSASPKWNSVWSACRASCPDSPLWYRSESLLGIPSLRSRWQTSFACPRTIRRWLRARYGCTIHAIRYAFVVVFQLCLCRGRDVRDPSVAMAKTVPSRGRYDHVSGRDVPVVLRPIVCYECAVGHLSLRACRQRIV